MEKSRFEDNDVLIELKDGIMYVIFKKDVIVTKSLSEKIISERIKMSENISYPVLTDGRNLKYWTMESRNNDMKKEAYHLISFTAMVINSKPIRIMLDFAVKYLPMPIESRVFNDFNKAEEWLKSKSPIKVQ